MDAVMDFFWAALPWLALGAGLALAFAGSAHVRKGETLPLQYAALCVLCFALSVWGFVWSPGNALAKEGELSPIEAHLEEEGAFLRLGNDMIWAGNAAAFTGAEAKNDILAAGRSITVSNSQVAGSVRAAGQNVALEGNSVAESVTLAGQNTRMDSGSAAAVAMAAQSASFAGSTGQLQVAAAQFTLNGQVHGDADVCANKVELGPDTVVSGTLTVESPQEPAVADGAMIGKLEYVKVSEAQVGFGSLGALSGLSVGIFAGYLFKVIFGVLGFVIMALLCEWALRRQTLAASQMLREHPGRMLGTGAVGALAAPLLVGILCVLVITLPLAGALALALAAITLAGGGFAAATLGKIAFPSLGRFASAMVMALIVGAVSVLPVVGDLVTVAGFVFLLGYVLQKLWQGRGTIQAA
ncbi:MAG: hypothetical protein PUD96_03985 [Coriobacteriaceae bacterium]|nr:hypothetical protein [Coriobacteriaceae bacterium]MDD6768141.1 hypothetical protein [Coriobacteriaceae bacterium]